MRLVQGLLRMAFIPFERGVSFSAFVLGRSRSLLLVSLTALWPGAAFAATFDCVMEPSLTVKLGSPVASILSRVLVERGDRVVRGQVVAQIEASVEEALVSANEERAKSTAEIEAKQTILKQKSSVMQRKGDLLTRNSGSVQDAETAQADFRVAEQEVLLAQLGKRMAELELARSRATLEQRIIRSSIDGIVTQRSLGPGEYVHQDAAIITVARINPLNVEAFMPVSLFGRIRVGDMAMVRPDDPVGGNRPARVEVVDQVFDAASGTFGVRLSLPNPDSAVPGGLRCRVTFDVPDPPVRAGAPR